MVWKREEAATVEGVWDMGEVVTVDELRIQVSVETWDRGVHRLIASWSSLSGRWRRPPI